MNRTRHEDRLAAMRLKKKLQAFVARAHEGKRIRQPRQHALSAGASDDVAATVAGDRAENYHEVHDPQVENHLPREESPREHHGFLGHRDAEVADEHGGKDAEITPIREQVRDVRGVGQPMH
jgi:hypothetical protein